jgi:hypothetical protein
MTDSGPDRFSSVGIGSANRNTKSRICDCSNRCFAAVFEMRLLLSPPSVMA